MDTYVTMRFNKKSGKVDTTMESYGHALAVMWALNNTTKTKDTVIFNKQTGTIASYIEGKSDFPEVCKDMIGKNIEELCPGMLEVIQ